jgi:alginate O-acetyltransferase complex protein AlgI
MVRSTSPTRRRYALWAALAVNLGLLGTFKYYGFFQQTVTDLAQLLHVQAHLPWVQVALPLGISFFTFQGLAYIFDLYRGRGMRAVTLLDFLLFIAFFPKLLMGPICRSRDLLPQIFRSPSSRVTELPKAASLIASGLFKKAVLATVLQTRLVDDAFLAPENYTGGALAMAAYAYTIVLYCDFSGYTDMARGVALLFGYRLPENFNAPYAATDPGVFWRRWHATFSSWLREYIYFPLGGSKGSFAKTSFNLILTFTVCGLWHGATWGYVLWGALHGVVLAIHKAIRDARRALNWVGREPIWYRVLGWFLTFHIVVLSRILFKAPDLQTAGKFFTRLFSFSSDGQGFDALVVLISCIGLSLNFFGRQMREGFIWVNQRAPLPVKPVPWFAVGVIFLALLPGDIAPYIYFQF